jgi:hypothetical protein
MGDVLGQDPIPVVRGRVHDRAVGAEVSVLGIDGGRVVARDNGTGVDIPGRRC